MPSIIDPFESVEQVDSTGSSGLKVHEQNTGRMQIRIWQLLCVTFAVAIFFALINWLGGGTVLAIAIAFVVLSAFGMPIVIIVLAIGLSREVNRQLDVRSNRAVVICMTIWLICVLIIFAFVSIMSLTTFL